MAEPISTTTTAAGTVGFMALLIGWIGPVATDVMLVTISALAGCFIALSGMKDQTLLRSIGFIIIGIVVALVLSWALVGLLVSFVPALGGPYAPSVIAMFLGYGSNRLPKIFSALIKKFETKVGV